MSFKQVSTLAAAAGATVALSAVAYADTGKSPNGPSGPAGNPNPPQSQPHANAPQGPEGNGGGKSATAHSKSHGKSATAHSKSHGKSGESHPATRPAKSHANPSPGTPRKGGRSDRPAGKITICHATRSVKNPYVEITISVNGLHGHGPADDSRHHAGSWKDIIPAPDGGCPATVQTAGTTGSEAGTTVGTVLPARRAFS